MNRVKHYINIFSEEGRFQTHKCPVRNKIVQSHKALTWEFIAYEICAFTEYSIDIDPVYDT